ncbi:MAG: hypothetical protein AVDCRST_MAG11-3146 [uncultured Gemmatimonadaceae bacterium]|uniref:DUF2911 domain-containing protein n=1 Tax=uncultured Gemmatimonadaceae bacterium TaxID=246130 RepID=A0A6J4LYV2_9BACT|nr:MAG: hypothetical protein AVDCRST_MAG11-3146 [uncultured Gemmatimonadaceae bacterium]
MTVRLTRRALGAAAVLLGCASQPPAQGGAAGDSAMSPTTASADSGAAGATMPAMDMQPAAGGQQRVASPRDTAEATVGGARVMVDYSRPSKRGRQIYGGLVPTNSVWRTGANAATTLVTSAPLRMGSTTVPAGTYTLYSLWTGSEWNLIVNKQTGQWGTEYKQGQDLARIPMQVKPAASPVEQFTITVEPSGQSGGVLALAWDDKRGELPFTVAK